MTNPGTSLEVVRWYTRARRFPQLIGRTPDGTPIPFGPFTFTQVIGVGAFLFLAVNTVNLWGHFGLLGNVFVLAGTTVGLAFGLGRIPIGARNPVSLMEGVMRALSAPGTGTVGGRPVRSRTAHRVRSIVVVHQPLPPLTERAVEDMHQRQPLPIDDLDSQLVPDPLAADPQPPAPIADAANPSPEIATSMPVSSTTASTVADVEVSEPTMTEAAAAPRRSGRPLTAVQRLLAEGPTRNRRAA